MAKKAEGRPIPPEDYQILNGFVDRVQGEGQARRDARRQARIVALEEVRSEIPEGAYQTELEGTELSTRVVNLLTEAGFATAGQVLEQLAIDEGAIRDLQGVGPKSIDEMRETLEGVAYVVPEPEPEAAPEAEVLVEAEAAAPEAGAEAEAIEGAEMAEVVELAGAEDVEGVAAAPAGAEAKEAEAEAEEGDEIEKVFEAVEEQLGISDEEEEEFEDLEELDEDGEGDQEEKDRSKQRRRVVEFDPELGEVIVRRRRKPSRRQDEWEDSSF